MASELKGFIFRAEVLKLYRSFIRAARLAPGGARGETRGSGAWVVGSARPPTSPAPPAAATVLAFDAGELQTQIRQEFENNRGVTDTYQKKASCSAGVGFCSGRRGGSSAGAPTVTCPNTYPQPMRTAVPSQRW